VLQAFTEKGYGGKKNPPSIRQNFGSKFKKIIIGRLRVLKVYFDYYQKNGIQSNSRIFRCSVITDAGCYVLPLAKSETNTQMKSSLRSRGGMGWGFGALPSPLFYLISSTFSSPRPRPKSCLQATSYNMSTGNNRKTSNLNECGSQFL